jgi:membrane-bound serine protease (ClpP class)
MISRRDSDKSPRSHRGLARFTTLVVVSVLFSLTCTGYAQVDRTAFDEAQILVLRWHGAIGPIAAEYLAKGIEQAEEREALLLILTLDTPGGLDISMRDMVQGILSADVPVAVYVWPEGARAASAGVFLLAASHFAAMAPSTNAGAAHPVAMGGELDEVMSGKVTNDAVAYLTSLASGRGRDTAWCEGVVRESVSVPADSALVLGMIDVVSDDLDALISWCDGRVPAGGVETVHTDGAWVVEIPLSWRQKFLRAITDPNLAYLFLMLGMYGLFFELSRPGAILPGVVGALGILLAVLAFQGLPVNYVGVAMLLLGIVLLLLEIKITSYGALALGGTVSLLLGSLMLFENAGPLGSLSLKVVLPVVLFTVLLFLGIVGMGLSAQRRPPVTGIESLVGMDGLVARLDDEVAGTSRYGMIELFGEYWSFEAELPVALGDRVTVTACAQGRVNVRSCESEGG